MECWFFLPVCSHEAHLMSLRPCEWPGGRAVCSIGRSPGRFGVVSSPFGSWVRSTIMSRILFVPLALVVLLHFVQIASTRRARGAEPPGAFGTSPSLQPRCSDPYHFSHRRFLVQVHPLSSSAISVRHESQFILLGTKLEMRRWRQRLRPARVGSILLNEKLPHPARFGRMTC
jgi:hypothetical protein